MQDLPHHYLVLASADLEGEVTLSSRGIEDLSTAPPPQYGGPGDKWSPETLLVGAVVDCFILSFRAIARASSLHWVDLHCEAEGTLDRVERVTRFTNITVRAFLKVGPETNAEKARRILEKAESNCLVTNSLACEVELEATVGVQEAG